MSLKYFRQSHISNGPNIPNESPHLMSLVLIINTWGRYLATDERSHAVVASKVVRIPADH